MRSLRFFLVFLSVLFFLLVIAIAVPVAAAESNAYAQMDEFKTTMFQKKIGLSSCNADRHDEFRLSSTRIQSDYMYPQISGDTVTWWEHDHTIPGYFVQVVNLASPSIVRFPGLHPSVDGHTVAFVTMETSKHPYWYQVRIHDTLTGKTTPIPMKVPAEQYGEIRETAIGGNRVLWISWTPGPIVQGIQTSGKERIYSHDLLTGVETALTAGSSVDTLYGLKASGDYAVWNNDNQGSSQRTVVLMDFQKNVQEDLGYLDPGLKQTFPGVEGKYLVWVASKQDSDTQKDVVLYDISAKKLVKRLKAYRPGPPVLSDGRVLWMETGNVRMYNLSTDYMQTFTPEHSPVNPQLNLILKEYSGWIDVSNSSVVFTGKSENRPDVFLYNLQITPCISLSPVIHATPEDGYAPLTVTFDGSASSSKTSIQKFFWTFPLSTSKVTTTYGSKVTHTFTQPGTYRVDLTVTDADGKEATASQAIVVLNMDEVRITRDPLWSQEFPRIHGDYLCWLETYLGEVTPDSLKLDPVMEYGPMRIAAYNLKTGEQKVLGPTDNMYCDVSDALIAYIGRDTEKNTGEDRLWLFSLPGMNPAGTWDIGMSRRAQVSGLRVVWEEFVSTTDQKNLTSMNEIPRDEIVSPLVLAGFQKKILNGNTQPWPWQGDVQLLTPHSGSPTGYSNLTQDTIDNNWPSIDNDIVIWVDYADPRSWPDKKPVLWVLNITTGNKLSIPTDAVQIQPEIDGDRLVWINNWAKSRDSFDGWTSTLYIFNLSTGEKKLLKTLGPWDSRLAIFGNRVYWEGQGQIHQMELTTNQDVVLKFPYAVDRGFDPYCDLIAFADHRTGDYDIYLKILQGSGITGQPVGCTAHTATELYKAAQTESKADEGGQILIWNPITWILELLSGFYTPNSAPLSSQSQMEMITATPPPSGTSCDDRNHCTMDDRIVQGVCTGSQLICDDRNPDTHDTCDPVTGCIFTPIRTSCDDLNRCTVNDQIVDGTCTGDLLTCDDRNPETADICDPRKGCVFTPLQLETTPSICNDGNLCTVNDQWVDDVCRGDPLVCDDGNPDTRDTCDSDSGCIFMPISATVPAGDTPCDDGNACTENDRIIRDVCTGSPLVCDDGNPRTQDTCDPVSGCIYSRVPITTSTPVMVCPEGCTCMTPSEALQIYGHAIRCSDTPCAADYSSITRVLYKYCYRPAG
jgi:PKD repeat protein